MSLRIKEPLTERLLKKCTELEPMFTMTTGAAMELFGMSTARTEYRWHRHHRERIRREKKRVQKAFENLTKAELVVAVKGREGKFRITPKGWVTYALRYAKYFRQETKRAQPKKGYIIIFDIPEKHRRFRDSFRRILYSLGFSQLQQSVFLTHDRNAFDFACRIVANCELTDRVKFIFAEKII